MFQCTTKEEHVMIEKDKEKKATHTTAIKRLFTDFYEDPENSCEPPGKRDYVTKNKKRYLLMHLKKLHKKFRNNTGIKKISYQTFVSLKPFYVKDRTVDQRDSCVCVQHANFKFKSAKLKLLRILKSDSSIQILEKAVSDMKNQACMYGRCKICSLKVPEELMYDKTLKIFLLFVTNG